VRRLGPHGDTLGAMSVFAGQSYLVGPLTVLAVIGALALVLRWVYGVSRPMPPEPRADDFGLLREVTTVDDACDANALRAVLADAGIRSTIARTPHGGTTVLVFVKDLDAARQVLGPR
jgi:hypothetical protein